MMLTRPIPVMAAVPLIMARPSLATISIGARPCFSKRSFVSSILPSWLDLPSPISTRATCANCTRSPLAPTLPCSRILGRIPRLIKFINCVNTEPWTPLYPKSRVVSLESNTPLTNESGNKLPDPLQ